jgi:hypothetical protein
MKTRLEVPIPRILWAFPLGAEIGNGEDRLRADSAATAERAVQLLIEAVKTGTPFDMVVFPGGICQKGQGQTVPLCRLMHRAVVSGLEREGYSLEPSTQAVIQQESHTTRTDIVLSEEPLRVLGVDVRHARITVVSERYHCMGIAVLFRRLYGIRVKQAPSGCRMGLREKVRRVARLPYYWLLPYGNDPFAMREARKRSQG